MRMGDGAIDWDADREWAREEMRVETSGDEDGKRRRDVMGSVEGDQMGTALDLKVVQILSN